MGICRKFNPIPVPWWALSSGLVMRSDRENGGNGAWLCMHRIVLFWRWQAFLGMPFAFAIRFSNFNYLRLLLSLDVLSANKGHRRGLCAHWQILEPHLHLDKGFVSRVVRKRSWCGFWSLRRLRPWFRKTWRSTSLPARSLACLCASALQWTFSGHQSSDSRMSWGHAPGPSTAACQSSSPSSYQDK